MLILESGVKISRYFGEKVVIYIFVVVDKGYLPNGGR